MATAMDVDQPMTEKKPRFEVKKVSPTRLESSGCLLSRAGRSHHVVERRRALGMG